MRMTPNYKEGDLIRFTSSGQMTLCLISARSEPLKVREVPTQELGLYASVPDLILDLEGSLGLIVYVTRNKLEQIVGYGVLVNDHRVFCKTTVTDRYFRLVETKGDASR
jgi:hypothetical protein